MAKMVLVGMIEPQEGMEKEFEDWYLNNHVEDTSNCPNILAGTVYRLSKGFAGTTPAQYISIYEFEGDNEDEAEATLAKYQQDPNAWHARLPGNGSLKIVGAGWYKFDRAFHMQG